MSSMLPNWVPAEIREAFAKVTDQGQADSVLPFVTDCRMREVWEWFEAHRPFQEMKRPFINQEREIEYRLVETLSPLGFAQTLNRAIPALRKPSNMTPADRATYLAKVRRHAEALSELLADTDWDRPSYLGRADPIEEDQFEEKVFGRLRSAMEWSKSYGDRMNVGFEADEGGRLHELPMSFPNSELTQILQGVVEWSVQDDFFNGLESVSAIRQSGIRGTKTAYLVNLRSILGLFGIEIPAWIYATVTNVALKLSPDEEMNEDSARRQLARISERVRQPDSSPEKTLPFLTRT